MKLLKTIRFDASDGHVFPAAAEAGEWAVSGACLFDGIGADALTGKLRQAFANGFLGTASLGHATLVTAATADAGVADAIVEALAQAFVARLGAPGENAARAVARAEVEHAAALARDLAPGRVLAVSRRMEEDGAIRETFREIGAPSGAGHDVSLWGAVDEP
jgi:hypothetical protein